MCYGHAGCAHELWPCRGITVPTFKHLHRVVWAAVIQAVKNSGAVFPNNSWAPLCQAEKSSTQCSAAQQAAIFQQWHPAHLSYMEADNYILCYCFAARTTHALDSNTTWMRCLQTHLQLSPAKPDMWNLNSCFHTYLSHSSVGYCHIPGLSIPCRERNPHTRHGGPDPQLRLRGAALCDRQVALRPRVRCGAQGETRA